MQRLAACLVLLAALFPSLGNPALAQADAPPGAPAVLPPGHLVVLGQADASVTVIDTATGKTVASLEAAVAPHEAVALPDGSSVWIMLYGDRQTIGSELLELRLDGDEGPRLARTCDVAPFSRPHGCAAADPKHLWFTSETTRNLVRFDVATGRVDRAVGHGGGAGHMVALDAAHDRAFVANIVSRDVVRLALTPSFAPDSVLRRALDDPAPEGLAVTPSGAEVWLGHRQNGVLAVVDAKSMELSGRLEIGGLPFRLCCPSDELVLVTDATGGTLVFVDAPAREVTARVALGDTPTGMTLSPDRRFVAVSMAGENAAVVVDVTSREVVARYDVGQNPDGIAWAPPPAG